ncbi:zinc finger protein 287-like isoform X1 [Argiope bruennichi]|uniref:zinc finger protein 287-like isoform X1 n=1 Tax=Argiope bruennichi TaxID=94029 RepID=UPI0024955E80|nr:zinc finger protein 287-like isoform X1 [Argiope bruennichi]XP_055924302.1 zinc finger protein 287-like isoform X1 [Argiope bruennichi]
MFEIYSEVRAIISSNVVSAIEGCVFDAIKERIFTAKVEEVTAEDEIQYHLSGTLDGILIAKNKLEELLNSIHIKRLAKETNELDNTTLSEENSSLADEGNTSYDKEGTDKTSCLSDDKEHETNASSNGYVSTNTESSVKTLRMKPLSKKLRFFLKERPRSSQRTRARLALQLRTLKKKSILRNKPQRVSRVLRNDPDRLIENLQQMKLATEDSDVDSGGTDGKSKTHVRLPCKARNHDSVSGYKHFCELCSFKTKRSSHFLKHMTVHEKVSTIYKCNHCSFKSIRLSHLRRHELTHSSAIHSCSYCHYQTNDIKFLRKHAKIKHSGHAKSDKGSSLVLSCPHCSYQTTKQHYYDRHQRLHCSKRGFIHQCEQCCYKTHRREHYVRHVTSVHGEQRPYLCHVCGKAFKRGDALQQHHQTHSEVQSENANYKCSICEKQFRSQSHLFEHKAVHSEYRSFLCEICGASFKTRSVHRKHVQSIHRNPRSFSCDVCCKKFSTQYTLKRHKKIHTVKSGIIPKSLLNSSTTTEIDTSLKNFFPETVTIPSISAPLTVDSHASVLPPTVCPVSLPTTGCAASLPTPTISVGTSEVLPMVTPPVIQPTEPTTILYLTNTLQQL